MQLELRLIRSHSIRVCEPRLFVAVRQSESLVIGICAPDKTTFMTMANKLLVPKQLPSSLVLAARKSSLANKWKQLSRTRPFRTDRQQQLVVDLELVLQQFNTKLDVRCKTDER